jgi:hypothetical protein
VPRHKAEKQQMKSIVFFRLLIPATLALACVNKNQVEKTTVEADTDTTVKVRDNTTDTFTTRQVIPRVVCAADSSQSYAIYIPGKGRTAGLPIIYFFDPHGDGAYPLDKYKSLAEGSHCILIGSNNSKNGNELALSENIWKVMFDDSQRRLRPGDIPVFTCGFSGGAKVASYIALANPGIRGVIANGAGLPDGTPAGNFTFTFTAVTGEGDMNMTDLVALNADLDKTPTVHHILFFDGKHEWAPPATMDVAFKTLLLDGMHTKLIAVNDSMVDHVSAAAKKGVEGYLQIHRLTRAAQECRLAVSLLCGLSNEWTWFRDKEASINSDPNYQKELNSERDLLATEQSLKESYGQQFQQGDITYWTKTIRDLQLKAKASTAEGGMYQRLLAYLSLAFYSISNRSINAGQTKQAGYFVRLYKLADTTNPEAWYFSAILHARNNNSKAAEDDLLAAAGLGFTDQGRMVNQPEFQKLSPQINFDKIRAAMKSLKK